MTEKEFEEAVKRISGGEGGASDKDKLLLYGYYKQATCGRCTGKRPGMLSFVARAKWDAWNELGDMDKETAMKKYIEEADRIVPVKHKGETSEKSEDTQTTKKKETWVVFSQPVMESGDDDDKVDDKNNDDDDAIWGLIDNDDIEGVVKEMKMRAEQGKKMPVNRFGYTPLHYAVEKGKENIVKALVCDERVSHFVNVNERDNDGNTPLHIAALVEEWSCAKLLIEAGADKQAKDGDGNAPELPDCF